MITREYYALTDAGIERSEIPDSMGKNLSKLPKNVYFSEAHIDGNFQIFIEDTVRLKYVKEFKINAPKTFLNLFVYQSNIVNHIFKSHQQYIEYHGCKFLQDFGPFKEDEYFTEIHFHFDMHGSCEGRK